MESDTPKIKESAEAYIKHLESQLKVEPNRSLKDVLKELNKIRSKVRT